MKSPLIILCASISLFFSEAAVLDYSNITPWSVVYVVYPIYDSDSDSLIDIWKNEKPLGKLDNSENLEINSRKNNLRKEILDNNDLYQDKTSDNKNNKNLKTNLQTQISLWPANYRNWQKNSNKLQD